MAVTTIVSEYVPATGNDPVAPMVTRTGYTNPDRLVWPDPLATGITPVKSAATLFTVTA